MSLGLSTADIQPGSFRLSLRNGQLLVPRPLHDLLLWNGLDRADHVLAFLTEYEPEVRAMLRWTSEDYQHAMSEANALLPHSAPATPGLLQVGGVRAR